MLDVGMLNEIQKTRFRF